MYITCVSLYSQIHTSTGLCGFHRTDSSLCRVWICTSGLTLSASEPITTITYHSERLVHWQVHSIHDVLLSRGGNVRNNSTFHQKLSNIPPYTLSKTVINSMKLKERARITSSCAVEFFKLVYGKAAIAAHWCYIYTLPQWTTFWLKIENEMKRTMT